MSSRVLSGLALAAAAAVMFSTVAVSGRRFCGGFDLAAGLQSAIGFLVTEAAAAAPACRAAPCSRTDAAPSTVP